jgi:hypothetical protein
MDKYNFLLISLVEAIYVVYMMNYFKTRYSLAHPFTYFENKFLYHPIGVADKPICNICPLGNKGSVLIAIFLILRWIIFNNTSNKVYLKGLKMFSMLVLSIAFLLSLLNFNAVVYLLPYFILEIYIIKNVL